MLPAKDTVRPIRLESPLEFLDITQTKKGMVLIDYPTTEPGVFFHLGDSIHAACPNRRDHKWTWTNGYALHQIRGQFLVIARDLVDPTLQELEQLRAHFEETHDVWAPRKKTLRGSKMRRSRA